MCSATAVYSPRYRFDEEKYLFIDGGYFREAVKTISDKYFPGLGYEPDYEKVSSGFRKTFFYDCLPGKKSQETEEEYTKRTTPYKEFFNKLKKIRGFHVHEGRVYEGKNPRQKMVDVMIAVDMLNHTIRGNMSQATFIGGDLDFKPLLDALVQNGMFITLLYEKDGASEDLINAADDSRPITVDTLYVWASSKFQKLFRMPKGVSTTDDETKGYMLKSSGVTASGEFIELHYNNGVYCISYPDNLNDGYKVFVKHNNLEFLEKYVKDVRCKYEWNS